MTSLLAVLAGGVVAGLVMGATPARRGAALALCVALLPAPFYLPAPTALRSVLAFFAAWFVLHAVELAADGAELPAWRRALHMLALFDSRHLRSVPRRLDAPALGQVLGWAALAAVALWAALETGVLALRWLCGAAASYAAFDAAVGTARVVLGALGFAAPQLHDAPIKSRSVREFWGARWNLLVHAWLKQFIFDPVRRRSGPRAATLATFAFSAAHHFYLVWPALGLRMAACMGAFFAVQPLLLVAERALGTRTWPEPAARAFTVGSITLTSPLFVEPILRLIESAR